LELISMPDVEGIICVSYLLWFFLWIVL